MTDITVRPARPAELAAVGELTVAAYQELGFAPGSGYAVELADAASRARDAELLVAVTPDDDLLGTVTVVRPGTPFAEVSRPGELEFRMLAVAPSARGRRVGDLLVQAVIDRATALGIPRVVLCSKREMHAAQRIYQRFGFTRLPDRDWRPTPTIDLLAYSLDLDVRS